jgi:hypothetical protein
VVDIVKNEKQELQHHNTNTNGKYTAIKYESEYIRMCVIHDTEATSRVLRALCQETRDAPLEHEQAFAALPLFGVSDYKYY